MFTRVAVYYSDTVQSVENVAILALEILHSLLNDFFRCHLGIAEISSLKPLFKTRF